MSDPSETETPPNDPENEPPDTGDSDEVAKWKALARKNEAKAKANAEAAEKLKELEDADKSELERAAAKITALEQELAAARTHVNRLEVAIEKGLDEDNAKRLTTAAKRLVGSTREEIEADADDLLPHFSPTSDDTPPPPGRPTERLKGGGNPNEEPEPDIRKVVADIPRGGF